MGDYINHHYIPKFLLKKWEGGRDEKLSQMRWIRGRICEKRFKAKSVAYREHLYSMDRLAAQPNVDIEPKFMSRHIDDPAALVHESIIKNDFNEMSDKLRATWVLFLVSLIYRGPEAVELVRERGIDALSSQFEVNGEMSEPLKKLLELYLSRHPSLLDFGVYALPVLIQDSSYNKIIYDCPWYLHVLRCEDKLLIGDRPLVFIKGRKNGGIFYLPLAPNLAFFASTSSVVWKDFILNRSDQNLVRILNREMVEQASIYVWGSDFDHQKLLNQRLLPTRAGLALGIGKRSAV
ncbi:DUF4238 domain-containing protein [Lysobacter enzymogenes]|uniref:DUF4238 domain-containing protein n=1 Tax=Lysobacter enzymogenes TaxID=69 RepID=UPI001AF728F4|nr:DUF4238 domain-containing protein [Lysobacter enzymogenes]QQP99096.1 DUF4238 domain-containing protein [Lysobacter enzymogenes]